MSRTVEIALASEHTEKILPRIKQLDGLVGLKLQKDISIKPKGDVLSFTLTNSAVSKFMSLMEQEGLLLHDEVSITTSKPTSVISKSSSDEILKEPHETSWEDVLKDLLHDSNMTFNTQMVMALSGMVAAIGISTSSLHVVIGAMLIAPGFEPISRLALGVVAKHRDWINGLKDTLKGYFWLIVGAVMGGLILKMDGKQVIPGSSTYLEEGALVEYWTTITATSIIILIFASIAGGIIIMTNKSLLTAGVMVALALIPTASLFGMALLEGRYEMAQTSLIRFLLEIFIVATMTGLIFLWKRYTTHKRDMRL